MSSLSHPLSFLSVWQPKVDDDVEWEQKSQLQFQKAYCWYFSMLFDTIILSSMFKQFHISRIKQLWKIRLNDLKLTDDKKKKSQLSINKWKISGENTNAYMTLKKMHGDPTCYFCAWVNLTFKIIAAMKSKEKQNPYIQNNN